MARTWTEPYYLRLCNPRQRRPHSLTLVTASENLGQQCIHEVVLRNQSSDVWTALSKMNGAGLNPCYLSLVLPVDPGEGRLSQVQLPVGRQSETFWAALSQTVSDCLQKNSPAFISSISYVNTSVSIVCTSICVNFCLCKGGNIDSSV